MKILQEEKLENTGSRKTQLKQQCCPSPPQEEKEKDPVKKNHKQEVRRCFKYKHQICQCLFADGQITKSKVEKKKSKVVGVGHAE